MRSPVAQLVEHSAVNRMVAGSSPAWGAIYFLSNGLVKQVGPPSAFIHNSLPENKFILHPELISKSIVFWITFHYN